MEKDNKSLVSVIVPIYNTEKYLKRCIESVLAQTYENLELILVDDVSPDNSAQICREYEKKDVRVRFLPLEKNQGVSMARNAGMAISNGAYITFLDSDDWIQENMLYKLVNACERHHSDLAISGYQRVNSEDKILQKFPLQDIEDASDETILRLCCSGKMECFVGGKLYKRHIFEKISYPKDKLYEDMMVFPDILKLSKKKTLVEEELFNYRVHKSSFTKSQFRIKHMDVVEAFMVIYKYAAEKKMYFVSRELKLFAYRRLITMIKKFEIGGEQQERVRQLMREVVQTCGIHGKYTPMMYVYYGMRVMHLPIWRKE